MAEILRIFYLKLKKIVFLIASLIYITVLMQFKNVEIWHTWHIHKMCIRIYVNTIACECKCITKMIRCVSIQHWCRKSLLQLARGIFVASPFAINYAKYGATASQFPASFRKFLIAIPEILQTREIPRGRTLIASERFGKRDSFHSFKHSRFLANPIKFFDLWRFFFPRSEFDLPFFPVALQSWKSLGTSCDRWYFSGEQ